MPKNILKKDDIKLGFFGLAALVFGMMVGAGIFNIPQNIASDAGPLGSGLAWIITAAGMLLLVFTFKILSERHPELNSGMFMYALKGFGPFAGFLVAWGYWLCTSFANVAYVVMLNDSVGSFIPSLLGHGWQTLLFGSVMIWGVYFTVISGMRSATIFNAALTVTKIGCIAAIIVLLIANFRFEQFVEAFSASATRGNPLSGLSIQIRDSMLVTLWCFIGIEGAVMMSGRARRRKDVGKAGIAGFFSAWILYVLISLLCFGVMTRASLAELPNPSIAYVLLATCGEWAYWMVIASVIISIGGGWIAWSLVCAEVPYAAAAKGLFPRRFHRLNAGGVPAFGLLVSSIIMQGFLILLMFAEDLYDTALSITGMMILPAYLITALFLCRSALKNDGRRPVRKILHNTRLWIGIACSLFCLWMIYAGGLELLLHTSVFYLIGLVIDIKARKERNLPAVPASRRAGVAALLIAAVISVI